MATAMLAISASAQQTTNKTLYIVDGKVVSEEQFKGIKNEDVDNMSVFEGIESAIVITTKKSANDVVVIRGEKDSNADALKLNVTGVSQAKMDDVTILNSDTDVLIQKTPLMLLTDGKKTMKIKSVSASNINPEDILHMTVIDCPTVLNATVAEQYKKYGDPSNGVIIIQVKDLNKYKKEK